MTARHARCFLFFFALLFSVSAGASSMLSYELSTLRDQAELVVYAKVTASKSRWEGKQIVTEHTLQVSETWKGTASKETKLLTLGGMVDGIGMTVAGSPSFATNDTVVVFLKKHKLGYQLVGLGQGAYRVAKDKDTLLAKPMTEGLSLYQKRTDGSLVPAVAPKVLALETLKKAVLGGAK